MPAIIVIQALALFHSVQVRINVNRAVCLLTVCEMDM